jgi:bifunctional enzyme CysN/CysC
MSAIGQASDVGTGIVRIVACGSVDDGKSTLIGRLLFETGSIYQDEQLALANASRTFGTRGSEIDYALLLDGLAAEREQGITIDVSWRHLQHASRRFLIADCPGHAQYTRNMATGASQADVAIVLVDASLGLQAQSFQHLKILALFGVPRVLLAVNKMDKVQYQQARFDEIESAANHCASLLGIRHLSAIPIAAALGANVFSASPEMNWYRGPSLWQQLLDLPVQDRSEAHFAMPVQNVLRDAQGQRWLTGTVAAGHVSVQDRVQIRPTELRHAGEKTKSIGAQVAEIHLGAAPLTQAKVGQSIALRLAENVDVGRGAVLAAETHDALLQSDQFSAHLLWFANQPMLPSRRYQLKLACTSVQVMVSEIRCKIDPPIAR